MKKKLCLKKTLLASGLVLGLLTGCGQLQDTKSNEEQISIVCTTYPQYDWVCQLLGENVSYANVTYLMQNGVDMHSYQPSAKDMIQITEADLLIYVGGESESWVEEALNNQSLEEKRYINMMDVLGERVYEEELVEGMQMGEHEHTEEDHEGMGEKEYDEHVWLSIKNAKLICKEIIENICELKPEAKTEIEKNGKEYLDKLDLLDQKYQTELGTDGKMTILFADRFPFRYLVEDYGINYYAAFAGCEAETEASFETVAFLANKLDELKLPVVYIIETSGQSLAKTVIDSTKEKNQEILVLDSLQAVTWEEIEEGITYLSVMEQNLECLSKSLK